jgi:outer membrane protein OmpA-like peptidoglycan-associated protein
MKFVKSKVAILIMLAALVALQACKSKKLAQKPIVTHDTVRVQVPIQETKPQPVEQPKQEAAPVEKPNYNFTNCLFDFDSAVLKTASYPVLDNVAMEMKKDLSVKFNINGFASIEGTEAHNLALSQDRANAVKLYLVNSGVNAANLNTAGFGTANPLGDNGNEEGRALNRRVEIKKQN